MAKCDQGYLCEVCGEEVADITDSDLYLRYVIGDIDVRSLQSAPERHMGCNPTQAQFIVDENFPPVVVEGPFDKRRLEPQHVHQREELVSRGWRRLREIHELGIPISEYPLAEVRSHAAKEGRAQ